VTPGDPTVVLRLSPSVVLDVLPAKSYMISLPYVMIPEDSKPVSSYLTGALASLQQQLDVAFAGNGRDKTTTSALVKAVVEEVRRDPRHARSLVQAELANELFETRVGTQDQKDWELTRIGAKRAAIEIYAKNIETMSQAFGSRIVLNFTPDREPCPSGFQDCTIPINEALYDVHFSARGNRDFPIIISDPSCNGNDCSARSIVVHVDSSTNDLTFSAGAALPNLRDERYQIGAASNPDGTKSLKRIEPDATAAPHLAVFANWCWFKYPYFCLPSFGITTDSSLSNGLAFLLGPSLRVKPVATLNSFYLSAGVVYGQRKAISDDFAGMTSVPSNVTKDSLLTNKWRASWFVGVSFGFVSGAEQKFAGVFSGSHTPTSPTGNNTRTDAPTDKPASPPSPPTNPDSPQPPTSPPPSGQPIAPMP